MCEFFLNFLQPQKNKMSDDETSDAVIKILWFNM